MSLPATHQVVVLPEHHDDVEVALESLRIEERPLPEPGPGEVLVKVLAAPCNPSDLLYLQDRYGVRKTLPAVPGWEGCGEVVASGGGLVGRFLVGRRVACAGQGDFDGTWAGYYVTKADNCLPLIGGMDPVQGASLIVNPLTAVGLIDEARRGGARGAVHLAAASQLGRVMVRLARDEGFTLVNVVRREAQAELLRGLGAEHVLLSTAEDYPAQLAETCARLGVSVGFDPVAGEATGGLAAALGEGGRVLVYGALSEQDCAALSPIDLIFHQQRVEGFWLTKWIERQSLVSIFWKSRKLQQLYVAGELETAVRAEVGFEQFVPALKEYVGEMTAGKVILRPHG